MSRYIRPLLNAKIVNPFPGIVWLERMLGRSIKSRIGSNEGLPIDNAAITASFGARFAELARLYPDPSALALRELVASQLQLGVDQLLFDAGADSLILLVLRTVCEPGDAVVGSAGTYPTFRYFAEGLGAQVHEVAYDDGHATAQTDRLQPDLNGLLEAAHRQRAKLVYLANPDNPSGRYFDEPAVRAFRAALPDDCLLLLDEAYIDFAPIPASPSPLTTVWPNTVRLRTLSKAYAAAGLRLGYAIAEPDWIDRANQLRVHYAVSNVTHAAGLLLLQDQNYKQQLVRETLALRQQLQQAIMTSASEPLQLQILPSATNFLALRYRSSEHAAAIQKKLWDRQAAVHRPPHPALQHLLRVTAGPDALATDIVALLAGH